MELTFNTKIVDVSVALNALKHYRAGQFREAISALIEILDVEPKNWDARLMLAACYYKTGQYAAASRAFRFLYEQADAEEVRKRAHEGLLSTNTKLGTGVSENLEFGGHIERHVKKVSPNWLS